jgi:hypothetical protein
MPETCLNISRTYERRIAKMYNPVLMLLYSFGTLALTARPAYVIPKADGQYFGINGPGKYHAGTNAYWLAFLQNNSDVDLVLDHMADANLTIVRIWGFNDIAAKPQSGR